MDRAAPLTRTLLAGYALLAAIAGVLLFVLAEETDEWFSWTIAPPLTAAFLGAAYWAALVLFAATLRDGSSAAARLALVPTLVISAGLLWATLLHEDRFHDDLFGRFWLVAYILAVPATLLMAAGELRRRAPRDPARLRLPRPLRLALGLQGLALAALGIALFADPASTADDLWPWQLTPLTARATGTFCAGFGAAALYAALVDDPRRFAAGSLAYAALGLLELVALLRFGGDLHASPLGEAAYVAAAVAVLATGVAGRMLARRAPQPERSARHASSVS